MKPAAFLIHLTLQQKLDANTSAWLGDLETTVEGDRTILTGTLADQIALFGLLTRVRDLGLQVDTIEINRAT